MHLSVWWMPVKTKNTTRFETCKNTWRFKGLRFMKPNSPPVRWGCLDFVYQFLLGSPPLLSLCSRCRSSWQDSRILVRQPSASQIACGCWTCGQKMSECISKNSPECQKICHCQNVCQKMQAGVSENMSQNILDTCRKTCQKTCQNRQNYMLEYNKFQKISQRDCHDCHSTGMPGTPQ